MHELARRVVHTPSGAVALLASHAAVWPRDQFLPQRESRRLGQGEQPGRNARQYWCPSQQGRGRLLEVMKFIKPD
jgi:hypothetical protein